MSRRGKNKRKSGKNTKPDGRPPRRRKDAIGTDGLPADYWKACELVRDGQYEQAGAAYAMLERAASKGDSRLRVLIQNDLAVLAAVYGKYDEACQGWRAGIESNNECLPARLNLGLLEAELSWAVPVANSEEEGGPTGVSAPPDSAPAGVSALREGGANTGRQADRGVGPTGQIRVAVLSFLFNWPSTGGGNMHTAGLVDFLGRDGYEVRHFYARYPGWGIGRVDGDAYLRGGDSEVCSCADEEETFGRADGGVGDPRRTGGEAGGGETFGRADGGIGDPRRTPSSVAVEFAEGEWNVGTIRERFREAVDSFGPDYVVISDAWNMKPRLAEAMRGYPYYLLLQAQECLCPLNNLRLIGIGPTQVEQCPRNQLATPQVCHQCLTERGHHAGALHQHERALAGVGTVEYDRVLRRSFYDAEAVLVLNPITAALVEPYARRVCIVPWGIDAARFPWAVDERAEGQKIDDSSGTEMGGAFALPESGDLRSTSGRGRETRAQPSDDVSAMPESGDLRSSSGRGRETRAQQKPVVTLFMAAVAGEVIKGFHVAHEACGILRETRSDFELVVTFDPAGRIDEFTRSIGWCSQAELPGHYRAADICLVPTIAQDALSITSVEAMAAGKPVVASRIGGLPYTVTDGLTGLLFEAGNPFDLAEKLGRLLDDPGLRREMGLAGRRRFEEDFIWEDVITRYWRPLLLKRASRA